MDPEKVLEEPFLHADEFFEWVKSFSLNDESVCFVCNVMEKVGSDYLHREFVFAILDSKSIKENPQLFVELMEKHVDNFYVRFLKGLLLSTFELCTLEDVEKEDEVVRIGFIAGVLEKEELNVKSENEIRKLWSLQDEEIMPTLIIHVARFAEKRDFSDLFLELRDEYLPLLLRNISGKKIDINRIISFLRRMLSIDRNSADAVWDFVYYTIDNIALIADLCIQTLKVHRYFHLRSFTWCIEKKTRDNPELITLIVERIHELDYFSEQTLWEILTEADPGRTVKESIKLTFRDDGSQDTLERLGSCFSGIKKGLYRTGNKQDCIQLYSILINWLENRNFFSIKIIPNEKMKNCNEKQILRKIHEITEYLIWVKPRFEGRALQSTLGEYSKTNELLKDRLEELLLRKEYNPVLDLLRNASEQGRKSFNWGRELLKKIEYYFKYFPNIKNEKYQNDINQIQKHKMDEFLGDLPAFLSEVHIFEKLHRAGVIIACEPEIGGKHPEYLIEIDGKKIVIEVKNYEEPEDLRISGITMKMEHKFRRNLRKAISQSVPRSQGHPVILMLDTSRSHVDINTIDFALHGSLLFGFSLKDSEKLIPYRGKNYIAHYNEFAKFIQAIGLFNPNIVNEKILLEGNFLKHKYRKILIEDSEFKMLSNVLFDLPL